MSKFRYNLLTMLRSYEPVPLGTTSDFPTTEDIGRPVARAAAASAANLEHNADNFTIVADGTAFETVIASVESSQPTQDGFVMGSVIIPEPFKTRILCVNSGSTALKVGDLVVAGNNGTAHAEHDPLLRVKISSTDQVFRWQVKSLNGGNGAQNTQVTIEFIGHTETVKPTSFS